MYETYHTSSETPRNLPSRCASAVKICKRANAGVIQTACRGVALCEDRWMQCKADCTRYFCQAPMRD